MFSRILTVSAFVLAAAPAVASNYSATLAAPTSDRIIGRDIVWNCSTDSCQGTTDESRPAVICQSLTRAAGKVSGFLADGRAFTRAELDRCNAAAKAATSKAIAAQ